MAEEVRSKSSRHRKRKSRKDSFKSSVPDKQKHDAGGDEEDRVAVKTRHKKSSRRGKKPSTGPAWRLSEPIGGRFVDHDPVFSQDEEYLILSKPSCIEVYSTSTSLLARSINLGSSNLKRAEITAYALSRIKPSTLWVSTFEGGINRLDWTQGTNNGRWKVGSHVHSIFAVADTSSTEDVVYTREQTETKWRISAHQLFGGAEASNTVSKTLYESTKPINHMVTTYDGTIIVATIGSSIVVGIARGNEVIPSKRPQFVWREFAAADFITSLDIRQSTSTHSVPTSDQRKFNGNGKSYPPIHIVVGDAKGSVFVYEDIVNGIILIETDKKSIPSTSLTPRKMHWHREAVSSARWSHDGNYIISGGSETVLVLWQLDTGRRQFLPHLSAPIENLVVSPTGSSYALSLSDNSAMVISTAELSPSANVAGIQARSHPFRMPPENPVRTLHNQDGASVEFTKVPCAVNPLDPSQLLLGVAASHPTKFTPAASHGTPYLQTFDLSYSRHIARQALTRTNATNVNIGPEANKISEPSVKLISISYDGLWMATVDQWKPPSQDLEHLALDEEDLATEQDSRCEIFLKFWSLKREKGAWELVTRIDSPHEACLSNSKPAQVLDLKSNPSTVGFATIGEDGAVRCWRPKKRLRNDITVRGNDATALVSWTCQTVTNLTNPDQSIHWRAPEDGQVVVPCRRACLAYSADGTVIAACQQGLSTDHQLATIHLVDAYTGEIRYSRAGLCKGCPIAVGFVNKYLVVVSEYLIVWDVVDNTVLYGFSLKSNRSSPSADETSAMTHLAVNDASRTFSVALPVVNKGFQAKLTQRNIRKGQSQLIVFDPTSPKPLYTLLTPSLVTALVSDPKGKGYVVLDTAAEARTISSRSSLNLSLAPMIRSRGRDPNHGPQETSGEDRLVEVTDNALASEHDHVLIRSRSEELRILEDGDDNSALVVRQGQLTELFDVGPSYAMPPVADLFEQVASLCTRPAQTS
ncbi:MAG: hypothetical protein M1837_007486 [Sclerophora amabilis]|nr:MAG: hypothetical protein M1837_007486 [Sclerophora amabilis]